MSSPAAPDPAGVAALVGHRLASRYRLDRLLAVGGMAEVWCADDELLDRPVAVKILHRHLAADPDFVRRFRAEAVAAGRLHHPGIVAVFDTCSDGGLEAIVMELVTGESLRQQLDTRHRLNAEEITAIGTAVADALSIAHQHGLIHRDVKPANILRRADGRTALTDFGIAKILDGDDHTATGLLLGSAKYLAPEQVQGGVVDVRTDVFALGVVLYECAAGQVPWLGESATATALARLHLEAPPLRALRPDLPVELCQVIHRAIARRPEGRFPDAASLSRSLWSSRTSGATAGPPMGVAPPVARVAPPVAPTPAPPHDPTQVSVDRSSPRPSSTPPTGVPTESGTPERRSSRRWLVASIIATLALGGTVVAALLVNDTDAGRDLVDRFRPGSGPVLAVASIVPFDPEGTGPPGENDHLAPLTYDGDPATAWRTEGYLDRQFGPKRGVGLIVDLGEPTSVRFVEVRSPTVGWAAQVHLADQPGSVLEEWGEPVAVLEGIEGDALFPVTTASGRYVLIWITDLGDGPEPYRTEVTEVTIRG